MKIFIQVLVFLCIFGKVTYAQTEENQLPYSPLTAHVEQVISDASSQQGIGVDAENNAILEIKKNIDQEAQTLTELQNSNKSDQKELEELKSSRESIAVNYGDLLKKLESVQTRYTAFKEKIVKNNDTGTRAQTFILSDEERTMITENISDFYKNIGKESTLEFSEADIGTLITEFKNDFADWNKKTEEKIQNLVIDIEKRNEEIQNLEADLEKSKNIFSGLLFNYIKQIGKFIGLIFIAWFIFKLSTIFLKKHLSSRLGERVDLIVNALRWIRNITFFVIFIIFFFSEFTKFLPVLAIIGTALGFALRDIISSIIAWFVLGYKESLYKVGDIIKIEDEKIFGKVIQITATATTIKEFGLSGVSGAELSFPNKFIFEKSIKNRSKLEQFIYVTIDFICEQGSDFNELEKAIGIAVSDTKDHFSFPSAKDLSVMLFKAGLTAKDLDHKVMYNSFSHGLRVRVKLLLIRGEVIAIRSYLTRKIMENIHNSEHVSVRTLDYPNYENLDPLGG